MTAQAVATPYCPDAAAAAVATSSYASERCAALSLVLGIILILLSSSINLYDYAMSHDLSSYFFVARQTVQVCLTRCA